MTAFPRLDADALSAWRQRFLAEIDRCLLEALDPDPSGGPLEAMITRHLHSGGKRLRALLPLTICDAMGVDPQRAIPLGAAAEMIHNATLVHDDLQDGDTHRRGQPTLWSLSGMPQAINCGDAMFQFGTRLLGRVDVGPALKHRLVQLQVDCTLQVIGGQTREFDLKTSAKTPSPDDYIAVVRAKTGGLFKLPIAGAALLAGTDDATVDALKDVADDMGIVFQIQDDLLDVVADKGRERRGEDLAEGKQSFLVVHALEHGAEEDVRRLRTILETPRLETTSALVEEGVILLERSGAMRAGREALRERIESITRRTETLGNPDLAHCVTQWCAIFLAPIQPWLAAE
jgi:geranylgeranyl pyrophosphate synthase